MQPGVLLGELDRETHVFGLTVPRGVVSKTGVAGLTLGGGVGWLARKYGLTCDNVVSFELVTAEGDVLRVSADEHPDLFWALRGGGGNFGVVTSFEYRLHPVSHGARRPDHPSAGHATETCSSSTGRSPSPRRTSSRRTRRCCTRPTVSPLPRS